jgi:DNA-binding ferritin-like protein (Dps family)
MLTEVTEDMNRFISKVVGEKGQWRQYRARVRQLPANYRASVDAMERYLMYLGPGDDGTAIYGDLVDRFEQGAADGTPIREIVGDDPVAFVQTLIENYPTSQWIVRERERLTHAITDIVREEKKR